MRTKQLTRELNDRLRRIQYYYSLADKLIDELSKEQLAECARMMAKADVADTRPPSQACDFSQIRYSVGSP